MIRPDTADDFVRDGFCVLPDALSVDQVQSLNDAIDAHRRDYAGLWANRGEGGRRQCVTMLLTDTALDHSLMHPELLPLVKSLVGDELVVEEHSVMVRAPITQSPPPAGWHRDRPNNPDHPLGIEALSLVYYLTDVDTSTHCFSVVPESAEAKCGPQDDLPACDGKGARDLLGPAGTALLFNAGSCHAGRLRTTPHERRTIHIYFGLASHAPLSNHTPMPRRLVEHEDAAVRELFRRPNDLTRAILKGTCHV
ncbi:MAG: hypothetical protein HN712_23785 [Gemmatimonadetes bacterium]|jgi:ectoine hydroxylase-related dioxygenase (phytanoyl-CoA dioxygenase family)|nr:hypothetical protein [Gemmatimonadota bacterium]MBT6150040.1 hypothetical protein [Gemmatimonadota bacterium]MBT7863359.1 hypothetical protein [Gemmatimonadota bacterium]